MDANAETLQKALLAIQKLKKQLQETRKVVEPIAIVGLSCRFAGINNKNDYWQLLTSGHNTITPLPSSRWQLLAGTAEETLRNESTFLGSYLENIDLFDAYFFGITPREAMRMDPQQRLLLEVVYEAIEDAGMPMEKVTGSNMGVFASLYASMLGQLQEIETENDALYLPTGNAVSIAANRISYLFDLKGPSFTVDTACSSSLVAMHLASLHLQNKLCDTAIVCGASINLLPSVTALLGRAKMLSPNGQCKTFSAEANGYVQGEGIAAVILKPLSKAIADHDRIYAVIAGSAVNQDGKTNGLTAPNGLQQEAVLRAAYQNANIDPHEVSYVECHGTGTVLGDPIELQALGEVLSKNRDANKPCFIGSVKTNLGHLEPAAGLASVIKVALSLYYQKLPAHLHFTAPNPYIDFKKYQLEVPTKTQAWPSYGTRHIAGISGFGFGGTNAHLVLQEYQVPVENDIEKDTPGIFVVSAKDETALKLYIEKWIAYLEKNINIPLWRLCHLARTRRTQYAYQLAFEARNTQNLFELLCQHQRSFECGVRDSLHGSFVAITRISYPTLEGMPACSYFDIPTYPWQSKKYWPPMRSRTAENKIQSHPFAAEVIHSPLPIHQIRFSLKPSLVPEINDTHGILHIGFYLEMLAFTAEKRIGMKLFSIENMEFLSPIVVSEASQVDIQLILDEANNFTFYSYINGQENWSEHAKGKLAFSTMPSTFSETLQNIQSRCNYVVNQDDFYKRIQSMGMPHQGSLRWIHELKQGNNEVLATLEQPQLTTTRGLSLNYHFSLLDACIQGVFQAMPAEIKQPFVTTRIKKLTFLQADNQPYYLYSKLLDNKQGNWHLLNKQGDILAECEQFTLTPLSTSAAPRGTQEKNQAEVFHDKEAITSYLKTEIANLFAMPKEDIQLDSSLLNMGMDSLMALTLSQLIEETFKISMPLQTVLKGPSITELVKMILEKNTFPTQASANRWINYRTPSLASQKIKLFCFPYGGGGASIYRDWQSLLPASIEVCPIQLPGRENRMDEKPYTDLLSLINAVIQNLQTEWNEPFAFFGHSFGALISFEVTRELRRRNQRLPERLFVSAYPDPRLQTINLIQLLAELEEKNFLFSVQHDEKHFQEILSIFSRYGLEDFNHDLMSAQILKALFPLFLADVSIVKNYCYQPEAPLDLPITVFLGHHDKWIFPDEHLGWAEQTNQHCKFYEFNAGHLFVKEEAVKREILKKITEALLKKVDREAPIH